MDEWLRSQIDRLRSLVIEPLENATVPMSKATLTAVTSRLDDDGNPVKARWVYVVAAQLTDDGPAVDIYPAGLNPEADPFLEEHLERYVAGQYLARGGVVMDYRPCAEEEAPE